MLKFSPKDMNPKTSTDIQVDGVPVAVAIIGIAQVVATAVLIFVSK